MPRIKIPLPAEFVFSTDIPVRITDVNYGGHLGNDSVLAIIHEARLRCLKNFGFSELDVDGVGLIMADAAIAFKSEAFHGDTLTVKVAADDFSRRGCDLIYAITAQDGREVARAKTGMVFFDYETRKTQSVPEAFKKVFQKM